MHASYSLILYLAVLVVYPQRITDLPHYLKVELDENDNDASGDLGGTKPIPFS